MHIQLRIYTVNRGALEDFAREWKEKIHPLRSKMGFRVLGAWTVQQTNQFVWLVAYDGPDSWEEKERAYYESDERRAMRPDPARHIARIEHRFVQPVVE